MRAFKAFLIILFGALCTGLFVVSLGLISLMMFMLIEFITKFTIIKTVGCLSGLVLLFCFIAYCYGLGCKVLSKIQYIINSWRKGRNDYERRSKRVE